MSNRLYGKCLLSTSNFVYLTTIELSYNQNLRLKYNLLFYILLWVFLQFENVQHFFKNLDIVKKQGSTGNVSYLEVW